jgi:tetratricopeptide (TPR) repeat protein
VLTRLGRAYAAAGRYDEALARLEVARERAEGVQDVAGLAEAQTALASIYLHQERAAEATQAAEQASALAARVDDPVQQAEAQLVLAQVLEARRDHAGSSGCGRRTPRSS